MLTLAFDTTAAFGSIALVDDQFVVEEVRLHAPQGFSGILFEEIEALLRRQALRLSAIDFFAAAAGPGSFTGVRIGLAAVKGLSEFMGKPAGVVSNLLALAKFGTEDLLAPVIDARRGEVYGALFNREGEQLIPEQVIALPAFLELLTGVAYQLVRLGSPPLMLAGMIAKLASKQPLTEAAAIEANYVRRSEAELLFKE